MEKAKKFIQDCTKNFSNYIEQNEGDFSYLYYVPWLSPDEAREAAKIAVQETIKEVCEWIKNNVYSYTWCDFLQHERGIETGKLIKDLKKHFNGKL